MSHPAKRFMAVAVMAALAIGACSSATTPGPRPRRPRRPPRLRQPASPAAGAGPTCVAGSITASGSTALQPLVDAVCQAVRRRLRGATDQRPGRRLRHRPDPGPPGRHQIGDSDITAEEKLKPEEARQLVDHVVARQGWVMVLNKGVTGVTNLTAQQATDIWTGKVTNWKDVGGNDQAIVLDPPARLIGHPRHVQEDRPRRRRRGERRPDPDRGLERRRRAGRQETPGATSVIGFVYYRPAKADITGLQLDGVDATVDNMQNGTYKLQAFGHMYTKGDAAGLSKAFLDYVLSPTSRTALPPTLFYAPAGS